MYSSIVDSYLNAVLRDLGVLDGGGSVNGHADGLYLVLDGDVKGVEELEGTDRLRPSLRTGPDHRVS